MSFEAICTFCQKTLNHFFECEDHGVVCSGHKALNLGVRIAPGEMAFVCPKCPGGAQLIAHGVRLGLMPACSLCAMPSAGAIHCPRCTGQRFVCLVHYEALGQKLFDMHLALCTGHVLCGEHGELEAGHDGTCRVRCVVCNHRCADHRVQCTVDDCDCERWFDPNTTTIEAING